MLRAKFPKPIAERTQPTRVPAQIPRQQSKTAEVNVRPKYKNLSDWIADRKSSGHSH